jgi:putative selenium metabolism hydrolase
MFRSADEIKIVANHRQPEALAFLRELIRTPSMSGDEAQVIELIRGRMRELGFDEVRVDPFGNVWGRIGSGRRVIAFDAHVDTVDVGDPDLWKVDPFGAEVIDGVVYGRGASDQKAGMAALVYTGALLRELAFDADLTIWFVGSVLEEDCDGLCWHFILNEGFMQPELVVLTEPTDLNVYRGHRGRMEIDVSLRGISCHGSAPERGVNAIHRMAPVLAAIEQLQGNLRDDPFLGAGSITSSQISSTSPSLCAVADGCTIHLDRRLTAGETDESAIAEIRQILEASTAPASDGSSPADPRLAALGAGDIAVPEFRNPSHTGLVYPMRQYFPAWTMPADHPLLALALEARRQSLGEPGETGAWTFSTNGVATRGLHRIPTLGFGPANEIHAHAPSDQCPVDHLGQAIAFYATFIALLAEAPDEAWSSGASNVEETR